MEERGTFVDGVRRGRLQVWDEDGRTLKDVVIAAPLDICVVDKASHRAVTFFPHHATLTGPVTRAIFIDGGRLTLQDLVVGVYVLQWRQRFGDPPEERRVELTVEHRTCVLIEIDASRLPSQFLGPPSACAM